MIPDAFRLGLPTAAEHTTMSGVVGAEILAAAKPVTGLTDVGPGATTRIVSQSGRKLTLVISHSTSNENKPFTTKRALIRLNEDFVDSETGTAVQQSSYLVITSPQGANVTDTVVLANARALLYLALFGSVDGSGNLAGNETFLSRVLAGEP